MSTISDAMKKKRGEESRPSAETTGPRVVQVQVPKDHTARNIILAVVFGAVVVVGAVVGGYTLLGRVGAFDRSHTLEPPPAKTTEPAGVVETGQEGTGSGDTTGAQDGTPVEPASGQAALPTLEGIFPHAINPVALLNGRRVRLGDVIDGYTVVAIEDERVRLDRDGEKYDLIME